MVKGMKIRGYHEDKAESQEAVEHIAKQEFQRCFPLRGRHWVMCLNQDWDPFE